jgi:hypothetical protein
MGLNALEDRTPALRLTPAGATWNSIDRSWSAQSRIEVTGHLEGPPAPYFRSQPGTLDVYLDGKRIRRIKNAQDPEKVEIDLPGASPGEHRIALNWISEFGSVAVNAFRVNNLQSKAESAK